MENNERKNNSLTELMEASMSKIRDMVDSNTIIGEPIQTPDGVTLIPVSRLSFGFGCGGGDYGKQAPKFGGASTAGVKVEPVAFLVVWVVLACGLIGAINVIVQDKKAKGGKVA